MKSSVSFLMRLEMFLSWFTIIRELKVEKIVPSTLTTMVSSSKFRRGSFCGIISMTINFIHPITYIHKSLLISLMRTLILLSPFWLLIKRSKVKYFLSTRTIILVLMVLVAFLPKLLDYVPWRCLSCIFWVFHNTFYPS